MANRFINPNSLKQIDLGDGDWVKIPSNISYEMATKIGDPKKTDIERASFALINLIKEWNLKDENEKDVPVSKENIIILDLDTATKIMSGIGSLIKGISPKELPVSKEQ